MVLTISFIIALAFQKILTLILAGMLLYVSIFIPVSVGRYINAGDKMLVITSIVTICVLITTKSLGYVPPVEPAAFVLFHLALVGLVKLLPVQ